MLICARGGGGSLGQIGRIIEGFVAAGWIKTDDAVLADLCYANDPGQYSEFLSLKKDGKLKPGAKVILNVLDVPFQLVPPNGDYTFEKLFELGNQLRQADAVTSISFFTQSQLHQYLGLASTVISNPIKNVTPNKRLEGIKPYPYRALLVGRVNDPNKRIRTIGIPALLMAGFTESEVAVVGGEYPGWGTNLGVVSDEVLNDLYNSVDFVIQPTLLTGLELPICESMVCGAIPLVTFDLSTFSEFPLPRAWGCFPSPAGVAYRLRTLVEDPNLLESDRQHCLSVSEGIAEHFSGAAVARRIIELYTKL